MDEAGAAGPAPRWLRLVRAGFAIQQTRLDRLDVVISPWAGLGVLAAWTAVPLALACWRLRRRDA